MGLDRRRIGGVQIAVIEAGGADIDADIGPGDGAGCDAGIFQRAPYDLQQQPLLRVHLGRFARRNAEYRWIETQRVVYIAAGETIAEAWLAGPRMEIALGPPAPFGQGADRAAALIKQTPKFGFRVRAWQACGHAGDGHLGKFDPRVAC